MSKKRIHGRDSRHKIAHQYIVNFKPGTSQEEQDRIIQQVKGKRKRWYGKGLERYARITIDDAMVEKLLDNDAVESIDQEVIAKDPLIKETINWGSFASTALNFWEAGYTGKNVLVALIDTGVNQHVDLPNLVGSWDVDLGNTGIGDVNPSQSGHGTLSAGVIGARNNNMGIRGVAYECNMFSICAYYQDPDDSVHSYTSTGRIIDALVYVYNMNPRPSIVLVNAQLSYGSSSLRAAVDNLVNAGVAVIAAAGNFASDYNDVAYPGSYSNVISVGAGTLDRDNLAINRASYSQFGPSLDVTGYTGQLGTHKNGIAYWNYTGTSCATPFVTGVMALLKQAYPNYTVTQLYNKLKEGLVPKTTDIPYEFGGGLVNLPARLLPLPPTYPLVSSTTTENFESSNFNLNLTGDWSIGMDGTRNVLNTGFLDKEQTAIETLKLRLPTTAMNAKLEFDYRIVSTSTLNRLYVYLNGYPVFYDKGNMTEYKRASISLPAGASHRVDIVFRTESTFDGGSANIANMTVSMVADTVITETFESSTLTIPFTGDWVRTTTSPQAGSYCYRSATISHNQSSKTSFKVTAPSGGTLEFYYRTDSEQSYDKLTVKAGSTTLVNGASGTNGAWTKITHTLPTGTTEIEFMYNKDGSMSAGTDAAYIDQVAVTGTNVSVSAGSSGNAPGTATISVASKTTSSVTLNLSASGATSYNVYRSTSATGTYTQIATSVTSPYTNTGLSSGTTYYYKTEGKNSYGTGSMSSYVAATTNSAGSPPGTASISVASKTTSSVTLNLSASGATSFNVYRSTSATGTYTQIATSVMSPYTNTGLSSGTTYYYKTEGKNSYGTGGMSSYIAATTDPVGGNPPGAVTLTVTGTTDTSVSLSYSASGASNYDIYRDGVRISTSRILTTYTDTGRTPGTTYSYYVVAKNNDGTSTSPTRTATTTGGDSGTTETLVVDTLLGLSNTGYSQSVTSSKAIASGSTFSVYVGGDVLTSEKAVKLTLRSKSGSILGTYTYTGTSNTQLKQVASNVRLPSGFVGETEIRVDHDAGNASYSNYDIAPGDASAHVSTTKRGKHRSVIVFNLKLQ